MRRGIVRTFTGFRSSAITVTTSPGRDVSKAPLASLSRATDGPLTRPGDSSPKKRKRNK